VAAIVGIPVVLVGVVSESAATIIIPVMASVLVSVVTVVPV